MSHASCNIASPALVLDNVVTGDGFHGAQAFGSERDLTDTPRTRVSASRLRLHRFFIPPYSSNETSRKLKLNPYSPLIHCLQLINRFKMNLTWINTRGYQYEVNECIIIKF